MKLKNILCPIDFSEFNYAANEYASVLAKSTGAKITYLFSDMPDVPFATYAHLDLEQEESKILKRLREIKPTVEGIEAVYVAEFGPPADRIVEFAAQHSIDLIVMGTHGRTGVKRILMGSVAEAVVRRAACPVLAIKAESKILQRS